MANPITLRNNLEIGTIDADTDDEFLFDCFVDLPALSDLKNTNSPKMLLLGSTGIGKTALIRKIKNDCKKNASLVELQEMSLNYIQNNDVIQFLDGFGVDWHFFFKALWKHIILIEYIRLKFDIDSEQKSKTWLKKAIYYFENDPKKEKAIKYLKDWEGNFFLDMNENIREITERLEKNVEASLGAEFKKFKAKAGWQRSLGTEVKTQLEQQARKLVDSGLLQELSKIIDLLSDFEIKKNPTIYYILIDKLDENWAGLKIKYTLIQELVEALKSLRRIEDLKVVVALRSDLFEKVIKETKGAGFQSEKYEDYIIRVKWNSDLLRNLVDKRINFLFKKQYTQEDVKFTDIFPEKLTNSDGAWSAIIDRSLNRPRDVINFINICLSKTNGESKISRAIFVKAEREYSETRYRALIEEWNGTIKDIENFLEILKNRKSFILSEICTKDLLQDLLKNVPESGFDKTEKLGKLIDEATNGEKDVAPFYLASALIEHLHLIGAIGVKVSAESSYDYFYKTQKKILTNQLRLDTKIQVHKMLRPALGIIQSPH